MGIQEVPKGSNRGDSIDVWNTFYFNGSGPWCATIIGEKAKQGRVVSPKIYSASSLKYIRVGYSWKLSDVIAGRYTPKPGDYRIKRRKGGGHIDMIVSWDTVKQEGIVIGGNVDDAVKLRKVSIKSMIADRTTHITEVTPTYLETIVRVRKFKVDTMRATVYASYFHGRKKSNGKIYDSTKISAASNYYPLGAKVIVINPLNNRQLEVQITDRMKSIYYKDRIDLSKKAYTTLGVKRNVIVKYEVK
jgi:hypothetical protein